MRIIVFGSGGMLGRAVCTEVVAAGHTPIPYTHAECDIASRADVQIAVGLARGGVDDRVVAAINCARVGPGGSVSNMALTNGAGPHVIADYTAARGIRLVHVSTAAVFPGLTPEPRHHRSSDHPQPRDGYGRTRLLGEPSRPCVLVVRTSFIGPESGLLAWLLALDKGATVEGWRNALWSGSSTIAVARRLVELATAASAAIDERGLLVHLSTEQAVTKYDVLRMLVEAFEIDVRVEGADEPRIYRALHPDIPLQPLAESLPELLQWWKHQDAAKVGT